MKLTDREYRILLAECASRIFSGIVASGLNRSPWSNGVVKDAASILKECGIENEAESDPSLKQP